MLAKEVKEWLSEYKGLSSHEVHTFACTLAVNEDLILGLYALFETPPYYVQELDPVCHQLYEFYRSKEEKLQLFSVQFIPTLVWLYLRCLSLGEKKVSGGVETFLLGVYNLEIVKPDGTPVEEIFRIPSITRASVYHESRPGVSAPLTEHALRFLNPSSAVWKNGPFPQYERLNAQNRFPILSFVMQRYNNRIDSCHSLSLNAMCQATIRLCSTGFGNPQDFGWGSSTPHRIAVHPPLLVEYIVAVYFALFNGHDKVAMKAVNAAHHRAAYELYSDVLLITNAMINSQARGNFKFETTEVNISTQRTAHALKNTITNASFKAKKLPDDIDIVEDEESPRLPTVEEDQEPAVGMKGFKAKLMNIGGKLGVDKNKNRDAARRDSDTPSLKSGSGNEMADSVGIAVKGSGGGIGGGKVMVDMLEMQPIKGKGHSGSGGLDVHGDKHHSEGKHGRISPSPIVFSTKSGLLKHSPHTELASSKSDSSTKILSYTSSSSSSSTSTTTAATTSTTASESVTSSSLHTNSVNGKANSSSSSSSISSSVNSVISTVRQTSHASKTDSSDLSHTPRAQSEGPSANREGLKMTSVKSPPSSSPSLMSSIPPSNPNNGDTALHSNSSDPMLSQHSSSNPQPPSSASTHSMPSEITSNSRNSTSSKKANINRNSFSTDL